MKKIRIWKFASIFAFLLVLVTVTAVLSADGPKWIGAFFVKGKIGLKWQSMDGASQYTIYRQIEDGEFAELTKIEKPQYFDTDIIAGNTYTYKIGCSVGGAELISGEKKVVVPGAQKGDFVPPVWSGLRLDRNKIFLRWDKVAGAIAYNIYRSTTSGSGYDVVGNATSYRHADSEGLEKGNTYYYVVTALNEEFEETEFSEERSIKYGQSAEEKAEKEDVVLEEVKLEILFEITKTGSGKMKQPVDVALNSAGDIYVSDALNHQINCYDPEGNFKFSFGDRTSPDQKDNAPDGTFSYPFGISIDKSDNIYVGDIDNHEIQVFTSSGDFIKKIKIATKEGQKGFRPSGLHVLDDGRIVTTDAGNHRFLILDNNGKILLEKGGPGSGPGQFNFLGDLTVTPDNIICIVDLINSRIQEFDLEGNFIRAFGKAGYSAGAFGRPKGIVHNPADNRLWVSDGVGNLVQIFTIEGEVKSALGMVEEGGMAYFETPAGMDIRGDRAYVVNRLLHKVMVIKYEL